MGITNTNFGLRYRFFFFIGFITLNLMISHTIAGQTQFDRIIRVLESKKRVLGGNVCVLIFITIGQCLSHTSGIESGQITLLTLMERQRIRSLDEEMNLFAQKPMSGKPGTVFSYGNTGLNIVGRILEVITHKDFETLFQERIAQPLAMNKTTFKMGKAVNPSGGATSTAADYIHFLQMILQKGEFNGKQIISPKTIELMQISRTFRAKVVYTPAESEGFEYGWGEWILEKDKTGNSTVVSSPGLFGTYPWIDLRRNYAAIVFAKNIHVKDRQKNYQQIRDAVNVAVK